MPDKKERMHGWKTLTGGILAIALGAYLVIFTDKFEYGAGLVSLGFMGLGIGHKIEKNGLQLLALGVLLPALLLNTSCTKNIHMPDTPEKQYLAARLEFNDTLKRYLDYYDAAPAEVRAEWKAKFDSRFEDAKQLLDAWGLVVRGISPNEGQEERFIAAKNRLIELLAEAVTK